VSVYKYAFSVMPDLIRHPEGIEKTGFRLKDCRNDRQTKRVYKQTLYSNKNCLGET
jgi:hypothetical protein